MIDSRFIGDDIELYIQPFYNIQTNKISRAEILVRGKQGESADTILTKYKQIGEMPKLDLYVIEEALKSLNILQEILNINISAETISTQHIAERIVSLIEQYKAIDKIVIEINENTDFGNNIVIENIQTFLEKGISISLDDFNTMRGNLDAIYKYKIKEIKLSNQGIEDYETKQIVVLKHLHSLTRELNIDVVVEGIETEQQYKTLYNLGFDVIQGFLISKPIKLKEYIKIKDEIQHNITGFTGTTS